MAQLTGRVDGRTAGIVLYRDRIKAPVPGTLRSEEHPLDGVSASLEPGSAFEQRATLTRWAVAGPMALAWKKRSGGEWFLMLDGPDFQWAVEVERKDAGKAREFASKVNTLARQVSAAKSV